jgi:uncharacterized phage-associated protein
MLNNNKAKYTAKQIANWFIMHNQGLVKKNEADLITNLKLQKLLYYAQGASLALNKYPLFNDPLLKWTYGPVVRSVYNEYKIYGASGINSPIADTMALEIDIIDEALLVGVYAKYDKHSAEELSNRTHSESPWQDTDGNGEISLNLMDDFFTNTEYKRVFDGTLFDDIPIVKPLYERSDGMPVYPKESDAQI